MLDVSCLWCFACRWSSHFGYELHFCFMDVLLHVAAYDIIIVWIILYVWIFIKLNFWPCHFNFSHFKFLWSVLLFQKEGNLTGPSFWGHETQIGTKPNTVQRHVPKVGNWIGYKPNDSHLILPNIWKLCWLQTKHSCLTNFLGMPLIWPWPKFGKAPWGINQTCP